jgi:hypothetical protein
LGGDDEGDEDTIRQLEDQLKNPNLSAKERSKIKRRLEHLRKRPSKKAPESNRFTIPFLPDFLGEIPGLPEIAPLLLPAFAP